MVCTWLCHDLVIETVFRRFILHPPSWLIATKWLANLDTRRDTKYRPRNLYIHSTRNVDATFPSLSLYLSKRLHSGIQISPFSKFGYRDAFRRDKILHSFYIRIDITQCLLCFLSPLSGAKLNDNFTRTGWCNPKCRLPGATARTAHLAALSLAYHGSSSLGMRQQVPSGTRLPYTAQSDRGKRANLNCLLVNEHEL